MDYLDPDGSENAMVAPDELAVASIEVIGARVYNGAKQIKVRIFYFIQFLLILRGCIQKVSLKYSIMILIQNLPLN